MFRSFLTVCCFITGVFSGEAQTKIIAHKSHSGVPQHFASVSADGNFGEIEIPRHVDTVVKLSDTSYVSISHFPQWLKQDNVTPYFYQDTIPYDFRRANISLDAFRSRFSPQTVFVGFDDFSTEQNPAEQNNTWWLFISLFGGALLYTLAPRIHRYSFPR